MEQSDLSLLQHVPPYHLQAIVKARHLPQTLKVPASVEGEPESLQEVGAALFDLDALREVIHDLGEVEQHIMRELVACGGRANSRDLALYLAIADVLTPAKERAARGGHEAVSTPDGNRARHDPLTRGPLSASLRPYAETPNPNALQYPSPHPHGVFEQALHRLLLLGLLFWGRQTSFVGRDYASGVYDGVLIVPAAVMEAAQAFENERKQQQNETVTQEPGAWAAQIEQVSRGMQALQRSLYLYWSLVASQRDGLPLVSTKLLSKPALRQVMELFNLTASGSESARNEAELPRLFFIRLLLMKLGLLVERGGMLVALPAEDFFALPLLERVRRCYHLWLETAFWNELNMLPGVVLRPGPTPLDPAHPEAIRARQAVVDRVQHTPAGDWQPLTSFIARAKLYMPHLLFPRQYGARAERYSTGSNPYGWDFRLRHGWLTHREGWYLVEGGFIRAILTGPLYWLGLLELDSEHRPTAFRLAAQLELITGERVIEAEQVPWGRLVVQPNFEMIALAPVSEALLVTLDRFAERTRLEQIAQYRLTKASVTRAIQAGLRAETIQRQLEEAVDGPIPQNVAYSLSEWERQARRFELWPRMAMLEVDDTALLDSLLEDEVARAWFGRRLTPTLVEVAAGALPRVQAWLWQRDYLPAQVSAPSYTSLLEGLRMPALEPQWKLREDGLLQPLYAVLNLFLATELERITERDTANGWQRLTPQSVQQAIDAGIPLDAMVRFLQQYCQGGISASFLIRLKLWGGGYERLNAIYVEQSPMLRLSAQALRDIQADEEVGKLLDTEVPQESRLVRVPLDALARVIELLRERGFSVEEN